MLKIRGQNIKMKKLILGVLLLVLVGVVIAAAPTTPDTYTADNSGFFSPSFTCGGSTDGDADTIHYEFYYGNGSTDTGFGTISSVTGAGLGSSSAGTASQGYSVNVSQAVSAIYLTSVDTLGTADRMRIFEKSSGSLEYTETLTPGGTTNFYPPLELNGSTEYRIEADKSGASYTERYGAATYPYTSDYLNLTAGSVNQADTAVWAYNFVTFRYQLPGELVQNTTSTTCTNYTNVEAGLSTGTHNWTCRASDTGGETSSFIGSFIFHYMNFTNCTDDVSDLALNFTVYGEETSVELDNVSFDAAWTLQVTDSLLHNFELVGGSRYSFCLTPNDVYANITGLVDYDSNDSDYSFPRQYYFDNAEIIGNDAQHIGLYQLSDTYASAITFNVLRDGFGVSDVLLHIQRYNPGAGTYTLVAMGNTDANGQDIIYLRQTDAWYRILAYEDGDLVYISDPQHITSSTYNILLSSETANYTSYWTYWYGFDDITWNMYYNNTTNTFVLTATDSSGAAINKCLKVDKSSVNTTENVCWDCSTSASVTLSCTVTDLNADYIGKFVVYQNPYRVLGQIVVQLSENLSDIVGLDGVFYAILIILALAGVGFRSPTLAVVLTTVGLVGLTVWGLIDLTFAMLGGVVVVAVLIIIKLGNKE